MRRVAAAAAIVLTLAGAATSYASTSRDRVDRLTRTQLSEAARDAVRNGGIRSTRWGDATPWLRRLSYELVERAFRPYGTHGWALYIVRRESGFNPGAVNWTYRGWRSQARCLMQAIPKYHAWVDYKRCAADPAYAAQVFLRMSRGGRHTSPWAL